jgi:uncharacterized small protein (DUF1192 family)
MKISTALSTMPRCPRNYQTLTYPQPRRSCARRTISTHTSLPLSARPSPLPRHAARSKGLNGIAESELSVLSTQCLDERISDKQILADEIAAWRVSRRNKAHVKANWRFSTKEARVKLHRLCPAV